jgi:hypothetical protein
MVASTLSTIVAASWDPELRGFVAVAVGFLLLCGSVYAVLMTNLGARLGFLVALAGLFGWIATMGIIWCVYGIGLQGRLPEWVPQEIIFGSAIANAEHEVARTERLSEATAEERVDGWIRLPEDDPGFGQAVAAADEALLNDGVFQSGEYVAVAVFDKGGERWPKINESLDFLAFRHEPHYAIVEVRQLLPAREEPGRAPAPAVEDPDAEPVYVLMVRDLGTKRQPAIFIAFGSGIIFLWACWRLHERDKVLARHIADPQLVPVSG